VSSLSPGRALGIPMLLLGSVLIIDGLFIRYARARYTPSKNIGNLTVKDILAIGFAQGLAAFPGVSRSGTTVSAMLLLGTEAKESFRLSFIALVPASIGATLVTLLFSRSQVVGAASTLSFGTIGVAIVVDIIVGLITINWLLKVASSRRITTLVFALGAVAILGGVLGVVTGVGS
jgi:undecaprenyl-diphosphatase